MIKFLPFLFVLSIAIGCKQPKNKEIKIFDVHLHGDKVPEKQLGNLISHGVQTIAISSSWPLQQTYQSNEKLKVLHGLFVPCPNGKVPYSLQACFEDGKEWPDVGWVERMIIERKIDFIGEVLTQYHGISSSDTLMYPYYALAEKYGLGVGIHTGSAGPDHGCPNFREDMGNPALLIEALKKFPELKVWLMHGGGPFVEECIELMLSYPNVYADISVLNNPEIIPSKDFSNIIKEYLDAGLGDRLMFGSDNADIRSCIAALDQLDFLSEEQKSKILHLNAEAFFTPSRMNQN